MEPTPEAAATPLDSDRVALRSERIELLRRSRLLLIFTPTLVRCGDPLDALEAALPWIGAIQVRVPAPESERIAPARETMEWTLAVLELLGERDDAPLVIVNDRLDVAVALEEEGVAGVHLGTEDAPPSLARRLLSPAAVIGASTHTAAEVVRASESGDVDLLGFGPIHPTSTKGYTRGIGADAAWVAANATALPLFPIGGIDATNASDLSGVGRAAVGSAILSSPDPGRAARELHALLGDPTDPRPW